MLERYTRPEMGKIWETESKYDYWKEVELAVCRAQNKLGNIPDKDLEQIETKATFDIKRISEIEEEVKHDVIAFLTNLNENIGESSRYVHMGLTSSDVVDTGLSLQIKKTNEIIEKDIVQLIEALRKKAKEHKNTVCIGRSHGIQAEPMTFGIKLCSFIDIFERALKRFRYVKEEMEVGQISGPVGTYSNISPKIEEIALRDLGLKPAKISTQVLARDYHAYYLQILANIASTIEQISVELRHLQRTEVLEVEEGFSKGQKGSSAMPHKKNPISAENLSGLARVVRSNSIAALENIPLWHERDISHSSVDRIIIPDSTILIDYMLNRLTNVIENLEVYSENMLKNTQLYGGIIYSQRVLLKLTEKGFSREEAYKIVQRNAHRAWNNSDGDFRENLLEDTELAGRLTASEIDECFESEYYLRNISEIYKRFNI